MDGAEAAAVRSPAGLLRTDRERRWIWTETGAGAAAASGSAGTWAWKHAFEEELHCSQSTFPGQFFSHAHQLEGHKSPEVNEWMRLPGT